MATRAPLLLCVLFFSAISALSSSEINIPSKERGQLSEREIERLYFFDKDSFNFRTRTGHGHFKVLERFTERSSILRGLKDYRVGILEANPQTFILPHHVDADSVSYVARGCGSITIIIGEKKDTYDLKVGDILRIPAGATIYAANTGRNEKLQMVTIFKTVSVPGQIKEYFGAGGQDPESFFNSFSDEILEAAFNVPKDRWEGLFEKQREGGIVRATEEQIRKLSRQSRSEKGRWSLERKSSKPYNILEEGPSHCNKYGKLYEATCKEYEELSNLDIGVGIANISRRSMMGPAYRTESTKIAVVLSGRGRVEIICPHLADLEGSTERRSMEREYEEEERGRRTQRQMRGRREGLEEEEEGEGKTTFRRSRSEVSEGSVFAIPAGHPSAVVSTGDDNLVVMCFGVNAGKSKTQFLAGANNVMNLMDDEALELSFNEDARRVREVFGSQEEEVFFAGPQHRERGGRRGGGRARQRLANILDVVVGF